MTERMEIADVLERAADLIEPEGAWTQGSYGGGHLPTCMGGAVNIARGRQAWETPAGDPIAAFLAQCLGQKVAFWNDAPERTQAEVVAKLREAAAKARAEQVPA
jgi:hypothetical protein